MTRRLTPAERLASAEKDLLLADIANTSSWDRLLVEQAVFHIGLQHDEWSCNLIRDLLPELAHGFLGAVINGLRQAGIIEHAGKYVPSTSKATHGHPIAIWRMSVKGLVIAEQRRAGRRAAA
ncbi:hypothetical protein [Streptomyces formicae]|uniref:Uncharacterized protein n=1 Tax=Streptomyces formicae TaxID=1616117 RepID=A0ABY3WMH5_9ACTN|nr:hypothetical protein [Streptomyces formicae]UNM13817.1 hypothetical protein J4032_22245 [Streptomyces formicae]